MNLLRAFRQATMKFTLTENQLLALVYLRTYKKGIRISVDQPIRITAECFTEHFNYSEDEARLALFSAANQLFDRHLEYTTIDTCGYDSVHQIRFLSKIGFPEVITYVDLYFTSLVTELTQPHFLLNVDMPSLESS